MRISISSVLLLLFSLSVNAEQSYQAPLVTESLLLDIASGDITVAVGERGHVLIKKGGGEFTQVTVPTQATLTAVTLVGSHIWAVGHDAVILHSADGGQQWQLQMTQPELERPFLDVLFLDAQHGIAIGAYGLFYRTNDGGASWTNERHAELLNPYDLEYLEEIRKEDEDFYQQELDSILPHLNRIARGADNSLLMAGEAGLLAMSHDNGHSWQRLESEYTGSFFDFVQLDSGLLVAAGLRGNIFVSEQGEQWDYLQTCSTATLNSILTGADKLSFIGNNGVVVKATLPLSTSVFDPYANPGNCEPAMGVTVTQTDSKSALLNAVSSDGKTLVTAADGIHTLSLD
ncbi:WD40/YVTN/BNR-like repeat-containing protein [Alteromonas lipolytica]|uniref:Photosynthesis system II assembly factor Ycf48/Hcf136-like domain-containing protein n=1 Tax=Alteromonas lipolytica TaxID=1856405 RepID=A0A1E8FGW7_9ALTE|nr:hypothetical protein [Alteromonas lipolytica]OFI35159.1 hypothetical protein BFC17_16580 [Alteromonas lipolytica]GGF57213.1 hypothetical protein GCM10011338_06820 [Alteromonas lipolytica]